MRLRTRLLAAALALAVAAPAAPAAALTSESWAECAGGPLYCFQATLFVRFPGLAAPTAIDGFTFTIGAASPWRFDPMQQTYVSDASDLGFTFYTPAVSADGRTLVGAFDPGFEALVLPGAGTDAIGVAVQFTPDSPFVGGGAPPGLTYDYALTGGGAVLATTTTPEPASVALLGAGLALLARAHARRRARRTGSASCCGRRS